MGDKDFIETIYKYFENKKIKVLFWKSWRSVCNSLYVSVVCVVTYLLLRNEENGENVD